MLPTSVLCLLHFTWVMANLKKIWCPTSTPPLAATSKSASCWTTPGAPAGSPTLGPCSPPCSASSPAPVRRLVRTWANRWATRCRWRCTTAPSCGACCAGSCRSAGTRPWGSRTSRSTCSTTPSC
uniref:Putative secreted protein n=1 Tax=Ixodes ricinus TaxID=34613 RepID=A0A147BE91_IXORI